MGRSNQNGPQGALLSQGKPSGSQLYCRPQKRPMNSLAAGQFLFSAGKQSVSVFVKHFMIYGELLSMIEE